MTYKYLFGAIVLAGAVQTASAQSNAYFDSTNNFTISVSDPSVTITQDPGNSSGLYTLFTAQTTGDGQNFNNNQNSENFGFVPGTGYVYAESESSSAANGSATQGIGENYNLIFTNTSAVSQTFTLNLDVVQDLSATGYSKADGYGGWEINYYSTYDYFTNTLYGNGTSSTNYVGFTGGMTSPGTYEGTDSVTYTLAPGATAQAQVWASGDTFAQSPVPEPCTLAAFGVGGLFLSLRRRLKRA